MSYLGVGVSPGNVPVYHGTNLKVIDRKVRLAELVLRCLICGLGVATAVLIGTDTQVKEIFTIQKKARFADMKALVFLVIANGIAAAYSLLQGVRCVVGIVTGSVLFSKPLSWLIFSGDQLLNLPGEAPQLRSNYEATSCMWIVDFIKTPLHFFIGILFSIPYQMGRVCSFSACILAVFACG
ncbi:CASP-like protein 2B1 isoform X3 [Manihot esculenta]|uniref:CASP-like protein 2B1 isoform X3 n=1 Tax=Manihot esculenta TaxID=3983 RepID=UPI000B5D854B|nr:CASP-like protein 2B1 isoform X3 [Manihot esculenta]